MGGRAAQETASLDDYVHTHFHEFLDNWKLPGGVEPRYGAPYSFRGEIRPWARENPGILEFARRGVKQRQFIIENLRQAYKEHGSYDLVKETFEREAEVFIREGPE